MSATVPALDASRRQEEEEEEEEEEDEGEESGEHVAEVEDADDNFKVGEKVGLQEQLELDKDRGKKVGKRIIRDDESLRKWKEDLLGKVTISGSKSEPEVKFLVLRILVEGRPPIELPIPRAGEAKKSSAHFVLKERSKYRLQFEFTVHNELLLGLQYNNKVWRLKRQVDKAKVMLGVYGPQEETYQFVTEEETTPHGMLVRGNYVAKTIFSDDDGEVHLEFDYTFEICKEWDTAE